MHAGATHVHAACVQTLYTHSAHVYVAHTYILHANVMQTQAIHAHAENSEFHMRFTAIATCHLFQTGFWWIRSGKPIIYNSWQRKSCSSVNTGSCVYPTQHAFEISPNLPGTIDTFLMNGSDS